MKTRTHNDQQKLYQRLIGEKGAFLVTEAGKVIRAAEKSTLHFPEDFPEIAKLFKISNLEWSVLHKDIYPPGATRATSRSFYERLGVSSFMNIEESMFFPSPPHCDIFLEEIHVESQASSIWAGEPAWDQTSNVRIIDHQCNELALILEHFPTTTNHKLQPHLGENVLHWINRARSEFVLFFVLLLVFASFLFGIFLAFIFLFVFCFVRIPFSCFVLI